MIPILLYHQIASLPRSADPLGLAVPPALFADHIAYLHCSGYHCVRLDELADGARTSQALPRKRVAITFDDGYSDVYTQAWPILAQYGWTATIFLVAERVGKVSNWEGQRDQCAYPLLSWVQVRALSAAGMVFGSHTLTHPRLTNLDHEHAQHEIEQSKALIEDQLGQPVDFFSYPYGASNSQLHQMVAACGYTAACGVDRGPWHRFNLGRLNCFGHDERRRLMFKLGWMYRLYLWLREESRVGRPIVQAKRKAALTLGQLARLTTEQSIDRPY